MHMARRLMYMFNVSISTTKTEAHHSVGKATYFLIFHVEVTLTVADVEVHSAPKALPNVHHGAS